MKSLWGIIPDGLSKEQINDILLESTKYKSEEGFMQLTEGNTINSEVRRSQIKFFDKLKSKHITDLVYYFAQDINRTHFGFDISSVQDIQYTEYSGEDKGFYGWHQDINWCNSEFHRKISITIQLSNSEDYEGGDLELETGWEDVPLSTIRKQGTMIFFPSFVSHRVTPVTKGLRKSLVVWITGPHIR